VMVDVHALKSKVRGSQETICGADVLPWPRYFVEYEKVGKFRRLCGSSKAPEWSTHTMRPCTECAQLLSLTIVPRKERKPARVSRW